MKTIVREYHELVDKKYCAGLTPEEEQRMDALKIQLDKKMKAFYRPILERIINRLKEKL